MPLHRRGGIRGAFSDEFFSALVTGKIIQTFIALEFIAGVTRHIPERFAQMVMFYGWYSNRMRGARHKTEEIEKRYLKIQHTER